MRKIKIILIIFVLCLLIRLIEPSAICAAPSISFLNPKDNTGDYPNSQIPKYEKLEINFQIGNSVANNFQWPFDLSPPSGVVAGKGITVNAEFINSQGVKFLQPAFYFQPYAEDSGQLLKVPKKNGQDWLYPEGLAFWKVRFAPNLAGNWSYKIIAQDAGGTVESGVTNFSVTNSVSHGFIKVSKNDSRYFEFDDGTYFPGMGYNMNWNQIGWNNPVGNLSDTNSNAYNFQQMGANGIQLIRMWLSEWALFGSLWNPWRCILSACSAQWSEISADAPYTEPNGINHDVAITMYAGYNACMSSGHWLSPPIAVKSNTTYRVRVRVKTVGVTGTGTYGFVAKVDESIGWLDRCMDIGVGKPVTNYLTGTNDWTEVTGTYTTPNINFLAGFYLTLTNSTNGTAYVDQVVMEENLGNGNYGPNIIIKPGMNHHQYMDQRTSYAYDKVIELAHQNGVYLRPVLLDWGWVGNVLSMIDTYGFYGNFRQMTNVRWYQQTYWRYMQARYGYSPNIHSWELLNEADPGLSEHYALSDELGKYMRCRVFGVEPGAGDGAKCNYNHPDFHLSSTSTWSQWPKNEFWANANYPNVDFADLHKYIPKNTGGEPWFDVNFYDAAKSTYDTSMSYGAKTANGAGKPVIRGETGFTDSGTQPAATDSMFLNDVAGEGIWLHNFIWGGINSGGVIDSGNWYPLEHIYPSGHDHRDQFGNYYRFIKDVPLSNGNYVDAAAQAPSGVRAWGQKDVTNKRAHLWIANASYRWNNKTPAGVSGNVTVSGFTANATYKLETWNTRTGTVASTQNITANSSGVITVPVTNLSTDFAVRIGDYTALPTPTPPSCTKSGDVNCDNTVNMVDNGIIVDNYGTNGSSYPRADLNHDGTVNIVDIGIVIDNFGR